MSNSQSDERIRQMSKQEEILLKRKREIEKKLKNQKPSPAPKISQSKSVKDESNDNCPNIFSNDGSFFEQFKKLTSPTRVKEEENYRRNSEEDNSSNHGAQASDSAVEEVKEEKIDPEKMDWFQDALKRAREKAKEITSASSSSTVSLSDLENKESRKRKSSRWSEQQQSQAAPPVFSPAVVIPTAMSRQNNFDISNSVMGMVGEGQHMEAIQGIMISKLTRSNPAIISYALKVFSSLDLTDSQWKQCEEQMKMNIVFQLLQEKKKEAERLAMQGKVKYEYDSDEDIDGGTWEHKRRKQEMQETAIKAEELTKSAEGKHHIGDFLPPEELANFMEKYQALKEGRDPDLSDYKEKRITEDNVGYRMLKSMGWTEGEGLGAEGKGITNPVNQKAKAENQGLGANAVNNLTVEDDEYDAYRKRMMLAYRFRPNPLNNPRRAYY